MQLAHPPAACLVTRAMLGHSAKLYTPLYNIVHNTCPFISFALALTYTVRVAHRPRSSRRLIPLPSRLHIGSLPQSAPQKYFTLGGLSTRNFAKQRLVHVAQAVDIAFPVFLSTLLPLR